MPPALSHCTPRLSGVFGGKLPSSLPQYTPSGNRSPGSCVPGRQRSHGGVYAPGPARSGTFFGPNRSVLAGKKTAPAVRYRLLPQRLPDCWVSGNRESRRSD